MNLVTKGLVLRGHMPTRRKLACEENIEDRVAGQNWLAGRPGIRPFGASTAACPGVT